MSGSVDNHNEKEVSNSAISRLKELSPNLQQFCADTEEGLYSFQESLESKEKEKYLPEHLEKFKYELSLLKDTRIDKIRLPVLRQLSPRSIKKISLLPPPNEQEREDMGKHIDEASVVPKGKIYNVLMDVTDKSRTTAQINHTPEPWKGKVKVAEEIQHQENQRKRDLEDEYAPVEQTSTEYFDAISSNIKRKIKQEAIVQQFMKSVSDAVAEESSSPVAHTAASPSHTRRSTQRPSTSTPVVASVSDVVADSRCSSFNIPTASTAVPPVSARHNTITGGKNSSRNTELLRSKSAKTTRLATTISTASPYSKKVPVKDRPSSAFNNKTNGIVDVSSIYSVSRALTVGAGDVYDENLGRDSVDDRNRNSAVVVGGVPGVKPAANPPVSSSPLYESLFGAPIQGHESTHHPRIAAGLLHGSTLVSGSRAPPTGVASSRPASAAIVQASHPFPAATDRPSTANPTRSAATTKAVPTAAAPATTTDVNVGVTAVNIEGVRSRSEKARSRPTTSRIGTHNSGILSRLPDAAKIPSRPATAGPKLPRQISSATVCNEEYIFSGSRSVEPRTKAQVYGPMKTAVAVANETIQREHQKQADALEDRNAQEKVAKKKTHEFFKNWKSSVYDELGLNVDENFQRLRSCGKAVRLLVFYVYIKRVGAGFKWLTEQTAQVKLAQRLRAAGVINRWVRAQLAMKVVRTIRLNIQLQKEKAMRDAEALRIRQLYAGLTIIALLRRHWMDSIREKRRAKRAAILLVQRIGRGLIGRKAARAKIRYKQHLLHCTMILQCVVRVTIAKNKVRLARRLNHAFSLLAAVQNVSSHLRGALQRQGASLRIGCCYRWFNISRRMRDLVYWSKMEKAVVIQKSVRGFFVRIKLIRAKKIKSVVERLQNNAVVIIQKHARRKICMDMFFELVKGYKQKREQQRLQRQAWLQARLELSDQPPTAKQLLRKFYRAIVPFRYIIENKKALLIQKHFRGFKVRKRMFFYRVRRDMKVISDRHDKAHNACLRIQRRLRGYFCRVHLIHANLRSTVVRIQCSYRQYRARKVVHQMAREKYWGVVLTSVLVKRYRMRKAHRLYEYRIKYGPAATSIQRLMRLYLWRRWIRHGNANRRTKNEISTMSSLPMARAITSFQLKLIANSFERDLGRHTTSHSGRECSFRGPCQAVFMHAAMPNAITDMQHLAANRLNSNQMTEFLSTSESIYSKGAKKVSQSSLSQRYRTRRQTSNSRRLTVEEEEMYRYITFTPANTPSEDLEFPTVTSIVGLFHAVISGAITPPQAVKTLNQTDFDMVMSKVHNKGSGKGLRFLDFTECLFEVAKIHFGTPAKVETPLSINPGLPGMGMNLPSTGLIRSASNGPISPDTLGSFSPSYSPVPGGIGSPLGNVSPVMGSSPSRQKRATTMNVKASYAAKSNPNIRKRRQYIEEKIVTRSRSNKYFYSLDAVNTMTSKTEYGVNIIVKLLLSLLDEPAMLPVFLWLEVEARKYLGVLVVRIQNMVRHRNNRKNAISANVVALVKSWNNLYMGGVEKCQSAIRMFIAKRAVAHKAQGILVRYIPSTTSSTTTSKAKDTDEKGPLSYWFNVRTGVSTFSRPKSLKGLECISIPVPDTGMEFVIKCGFCAHAVALWNCNVCDESFCSNCFTSRHCKGKYASHTKTALPFCSCCKYQHATKSCISCSVVKPDRHSPLLYRSGDKGLLCDSCFDYIHAPIKADKELQFEDGANHTKKKVTFSKNNTKNAKKESLEEKKPRTVIKEAYLAHHDIRQNIITNHVYDALVQPCEECQYRSASWSCRECQQIYCNQCLTGLHSIGGPFGKHNADYIPYMTPVMHKRFLVDESHKKIHDRVVDIMISQSKKKNLFRMRCIVLLQAWWRSYLYGSVARGKVREARRVVRRKWRKRREETRKFRRTFSYRFNDIFGKAPALASDGREESVLKHIPAYKRQWAREYIWRNVDDWGYYSKNKKMENFLAETIDSSNIVSTPTMMKQLSSALSEGVKAVGDLYTVMFSDPNEKKKKIVKPSPGEKDEVNLLTEAFYCKKGVPVSGFEVGQVDELIDQAKYGGVRMPGLVGVLHAKDELQTTLPLVDILQPGDLIRIKLNIFRVVGVKAGSIKLDRNYRSSSEVMVKSTNGRDKVPEPVFELLYKLPTQAGTKDVNYYYALYCAQLAATSPVGNAFFFTYAYTFLHMEAMGYYFSGLCRDDGANKEALRWVHWAKKQRRRVDWAQTYLQDRVTLPQKMSSRQKKRKKIRESLQAQIHPDADGEPLARSRKQIVNENGSVMSGETDTVVSVDRTKPWRSTPLELKRRVTEENKMMDDDLIKTHVDWRIEIDITTENPYYINIHTNELTYVIPKAVKLFQEQEAREKMFKENFATTKNRIEAQKSVKAKKRKM